MSQHLDRMHTNDIELGVTDAIQKHVSRHVVAPKPVSQRKLDFEHARPRIMRESMAEATGVFFYVFPGIAAIASMYLNATSPLGVTAFGSIFQIGWGFSLGIAFAIITCGPTSGGHFNPAITICFAIWQGFPWRKVPHYILSQIFGAFVAGMLVMGMYWPEIQVLKAANLAKEGTAVFNGGAASILCSFPNPAQTNLGYLFLVEFFVDSFIGIVIWSCLDPANPFVSPAAIFFGHEAFTYHHYAWIAVLVNVPATIFATGYYEFLMRDSMQKINKGHAEHEDGEDGLRRHLTKTGTLTDDGNGQMEQGYTNALRGRGNEVNGFGKEE